MNGDILEAPREGLIKQELTSWEIKDGMLYKRKIVRRYGEPSTNDYIDSEHSEPIIRVET
tara:strand:+ start:552 stop:731 length:180 start_codon:yes stop_codon:yes gene_type:complete